MINEAGGEHYGKIQPWHLTRSMESSGNAHVDSMRCNVIKYAFRLKGEGKERIPKLIDDFRKAAHCMQEAADVLTAQMLAEGQTEFALSDPSTCEHCDKKKSGFHQKACPAFVS